MPLELFCIEENDTRLIRFQNTVYKLKVVYNNHQRVKNVCSHTSTHNQIEQVLRAVLYMDQRGTDFSNLKPIVTNNFIVMVSKKYWKTSEKIDFKKNGVNLKVYDHLFEILVRVRDSSIEDKETGNTSQQTENQRLPDSSAPSLKNKTKQLRSERESENKVNDPRQKFSVYDHGAANKPKVQKRTRTHVGENEQAIDTCQSREVCGGTDDCDSHKNERSPVISEINGTLPENVIDPSVGCHVLNNNLPGKKTEACGIKSRKSRSSHQTSEVSQVDSSSESERAVDNRRITRRSTRLSQESNLEQPRQRSLRKRDQKEDRDSQHESKYDSPNISGKNCEKDKRFLQAKSGKEFEKFEINEPVVKMHTRHSSRLSQESGRKTYLPQRSLRPRKEKSYPYTDSQTESDIDSPEVNSDDDFIAPKKIKKGRVYLGESEVGGLESVKLDVKLMSSNRDKMEKKQRPHRRKKVQAPVEDDVTNVENILGGSFKVQKFRKKLNANQQPHELAVPRRLRHRLYNTSEELITSLPEVSTKTASQSSSSSDKAKQQGSRGKNMTASSLIKTKEVELSRKEPCDNINSSALTPEPLQVKTLSKSKISPDGRGKVELVVYEPEKNYHNTPREANVSTASPVICHNNVRKATPGSDRILRSYRCEVNTPKTARHGLEGSRKTTPGSDRILRSYRRELKNNEDSDDLSNSELSPVKVPEKKETRKRNSSGLWNFVEAILTPVKRFLSAQDGK